MTPRVHAEHGGGAPGAVRGGLFPGAFHAAWMAALATSLSISPVLATQVTLRLVDQTQAGVAGSKFSIAGHAVDQDGAVTLVPGTYTLTVMPAIHGQAAQSILSRVDTVQIAGADTLLTPVWYYADLRVRLGDQDGVPDDSATFVMPTLGYGWYGVGQPIYRLPVTVEQPGDPAYTGAFAAGYDAILYPSINRDRQTALLTRTDPKVELGPGDSLRTFVWKRGDLTVRLVDQDGAPDDSATFKVPNSGYVQNGVGQPTYRLPVTVEQPGDPTYAGTFAEGYDATLYPSINQFRQNGLLSRTEAKAELDVGASVRTFVWKRADLRVRLEDQDGVPDDSATFVVPTLGYGRYGVGQPTYRLPVTVEQPGDPAYTGAFVAGYDAILYPSINRDRQTALLTRTDPKVELGPGDSLRTFVWKRGDLTVRLVDQDGAPDDSATFRVPNSGYVQNGVGQPTYRLPVTVEQPGDPTYAGTFAEGYDATLYPSINQFRQNGLLSRTEAKAELDVGASVRTFVWKWADLRVRLEDQDGVPDDSATFVMPTLGYGRYGVGQPTYRLPVTVEQPGDPAYTGALAAGYDAILCPSINQFPQTGYLIRTAPKAELDVGASVRAFVWKRANLTVRLVDQDSVPDDSATFRVPSSSHFPNGVGQPTYRLPVTVEQPGDSTYAGTFAEGYDATLYPSVNQYQQSALLSRTEAKAELDVGASVRTFLWKRANLTVRLMDQDSVPDDSATFLVPSADYGRYGVGQPTYRLPVTVEQPGDPTYAGAFAAGYDAILYPSITQTRQTGYLARTDPKAELGAGGSLRMFEWRRFTGPLRVVDSTGLEAAGSAFSMSLASGPSGASVSLPVTEDSTHAPIAAMFAAGYPFSLRPSLTVPFAGPFVFGLHPDSSFVPGFVTVGGARYGLRWGLLQLAQVIPDAGGTGDAGRVTVTLLGSDLRSGSTVRLSSAGQSDIPGTGVAVARDGMSLNAAFDLRDAVTGTWNVVVTNPDRKTAALTNGFTIEPPAVPQLRVDVGGPDQIRANHPTSFDLVLANDGNVDALAVPLWLFGVPADATVALDFAVASPPRAGGEPDWGQVPQSLTSTGGRYLALVIPRVPPGVMTRRVMLTVPSSDSSFQLGAAVTPPWVGGTSLGSCLSGLIGSPNCMGTQLTALNDWLANASGVAALSGIGEWAKIAWQCEGAGSLPAAIAKAEQVLDSLGQAVEKETACAGCGDALLPRWRDVRTIAVVGSLNPNEKLGVRGYGPTRLIAGQQALPYSMRFENPSTASVPARQLVVSDQLDRGTLDASTVSLEAITFGNVRLVPPPGQSTSYIEVDLRPERNLKVQVSANLDSYTGVLNWYFNSIDPDTGNPPTDPALGFLPPNRTPPEGEGSVLFTVLPRSTLVTGTEIHNGAVFTLDSQPTSDMGVWMNTVDNTPPASHVMPLSARQDSACFTVRWETEGTPGDVRDYTIYASEDEGTYRAWRQNTVALSDTFASRLGHSYSFYSVARDLSGNVEPAPTHADAETNAPADVQTERAWRTGLEGARPNPARGEIWAWFTLASRERATLELIDIAGRRVVRRDLTGLGPGPHRLTLGDTPGVRPGLYFLRLTEGRQVRNARVVMLR